MLDLLQMWRRGSGLRIAGMISLYNMSLIAILGMTPLYLASAHDLTPSTIGVIFAAVLITGAIIQPWVGGFLTRLVAGHFWSSAIQLPPLPLPR